MAVASTSAAPTAAPGIKIPNELRQALLSAVKTFYSPEQAVMVRFVMLAVCISEESLCVNMRFSDKKQLRKLTVPLKQDKLLRERSVEIDSPTASKNQSVIYYFINYRAITNVFKYKI
ncbi:hypothetical protein PFISCL1PPCAC_13975, partial [Pristionchus fissidentatus]